MVARLCALDHQMHRVDDIDLCRMTARVVIIFCQDAHVFFPVSVTCMTTAQRRNKPLKPPVWGRDEMGRTKEEMLDGPRVARGTTKL